MINSFRIKRKKREKRKKINQRVRKNNQFSKEKLWLFYQKENKIKKVWKMLI
jgi:hypothetical protein